MKKRNNIILISFLSISLCSCQHVPVADTYAYVTFKNYDDSVLYHTKVNVGEKVYYVGDDPVKAPTKESVYSFNGWDYDLSQPIMSHTVIHAKYSASAREYKVTFQDYDGSILSIDSVPYGEYATYKAKQPSRNSGDKHIEYVFNGWDKALESTKIVEDTVFTAKYQLNEYVFVTFQNYDGTILSEKKLSKGSNASYSGNTPTRSYSGDDKVYRFKGWDKSLNSINVDTTFTAQFDLLNIYTVTFKNYDGSVLSTSKVVEGDTAVYTGSTPYRASTQSGNYKYTYTFKGWDKSLTNVTSSFTTTAQFTSTSKYYNQKYETALQTIRNNATSYDSSTGLYYKGFGLNASSSYMETGYGEYDPSTDVVDLYYAATTADNGACIIIYFDLHEPGTYYCTYAYSLNGTKLVMAMFNIYSSWSSSSSVSFSSITNLSSNSDSSHRQMASNLITTCLTRASNTNWIDTYNLGFTNF